MTNKRQEANKIYESRLFLFKKDKTTCTADDDFPGFATGRINLFSYTPGEMTPIEKNPHLEKWDLRLFMYIGRNFPSANSYGTCNPMVKMSCGGDEISTSKKNSTLNPEWYEVRSLQVEVPVNAYQIRKLVQPPLSLILLAYNVPVKNLNEADFMQRTDQSRRDELAQRLGEAKT